MNMLSKEALEAAGRSILSSPLPPDILAAKTAVQNRSDTARAFVNELIDARRSLDPTLPNPSSLGQVGIPASAGSGGTL